ncbi:MAG: ABC transporter substrate-binding protein [Pseudomonadota bacterium]
METPKKTILVLLLAVLVMTACTTYEDREKKRAERAQKATGDIRIALVWQENLFNSYFFEGAELAVDEINRGGGIKGRKIRAVRYYNESGSEEKDMGLARRIVADLDLVAVVGHYSSVGAVEASVTYEYSGILFIATGATITRLTQHGFQYVFRNIPSDRVTGMDLADFMKKKGFSDVLIIDDRTISGKELADIFHERASKIGINVLGRKSYSIMEKDFKPLFAEIKTLRFDAIFLGGGIPSAGMVIKQAREMGVTVPFIGGPCLNSSTLWDIAGNAAEGTITATTFHHNDKTAPGRAFSKKFYERYHAYPDEWAGEGYDAIRVMARAIEKAGTTVPLVVASYLRYLENYVGVLGTYSFTEQGDVVGDINDYQVLLNGKYELLDKERIESFEERMP